MLKANQLKPGLKPHIPDLETRTLRARLILEEAFEFAEAAGLRLCRVHTNDDVTDFILGGKRFNFRAESAYQPDLIGMMDACADLNYVSTGSASACGVDLEEIEEAVQRANMRKFAEGHYFVQGKLKKPPGWVGPEEEIKQTIDIQSEVVS